MGEELCELAVRGRLYGLRESGYRFCDMERFYSKSGSRAAALQGLFYEFKKLL
jgi:hypothetical protein